MNNKTKRERLDTPFLKEEFDAMLKYRKKTDKIETLKKLKCPNCGSEKTHPTFEFEGIQPIAECEHSVRHTSMKCSSCYHTFCTVRCM